jgi:hypothetical protein
VRIMRARNGVKGRLDPISYSEFEDRVDQLKSPRGAKTEQVEAAVKAFSGRFTLYELERACMGVSRDMVRKVLRNLQKAGSVECLGRGPGAVWRKRGNTLVAPSHARAVVRLHVKR